MSSLSGSELFAKGTAGDDDAGGVLRADRALGVRPSSSTANGDATTGAAQADSTSRVRPYSSAAGDDDAGGVLRADRVSRPRPTSSAVNGDTTTGAAQADSASRVRPSSAVGGCGTVGSVCVGLVDEVGLSDEGLRSRLKVLGRAESTLAAMKSRALAELSRRHNKRDAQRLIRDELQTSKRDAKRDVETATRLAELPATSGALNSGDIPVSHAQLIARAAGESPINETLLVEAAGSEPFDEFMQTVKLHQRDVAVDDGRSLLDRQRKKRKARIFESSDSGMFVLTGEFDQITGARIATALTAKERQLWHREDPNKRATPQQRMADALAALITEPAGDSRSVGTDLLVIADFDVLEQQLENPRLVDGSPIPTGELHKMALEANLLPSIFDTKTQDMWLGRRVRTATEAQRIALIARDQHCIGCGANPLWCQAHHIIWWSKNGPTDLDNLVLVCDDCHHKIHDDGWQVHKHPDTGKYQLKPPTHPTDKRPAVSSDTPARNSLGEPTTQLSGQHPTISLDEPSTNPPEKHPTTPPDTPTTNPLGESPAASLAEPLIGPSGERPTVPSDIPSTRPSGNHPTAPPDKLARTLPDELSTNPPNKHPTVSPDEPSANPSGESATNSSGKPPNRPIDKRATVLSDKSARISSLGSSTSGVGDSLDVTVGLPSTHPADEFPNISSSEPPIHPADQRPTISSGRPDRARTGVDTVQPFVGDAPPSTIQNEPWLHHGEQTRRKKQTNPAAEQQHPTTRSTRRDPVDGIDTS